MISASDVTFRGWRYDRRLGGLFRKDASGRWTSVQIGSRASQVLAELSRNPGALVSKDELLSAVWPGVTVEANNLTVQIAALRRALDDGATGESCIQTSPGRGYRLVGVVEAPTEEPPPVVEVAPAEPSAEQTAQPSPPRRSFRFWLTPALCLVLMAAAWIGWHFHRPGAASAPRMSLVVIPFENLSGDRGEDNIAKQFTDDVTIELSYDNPNVVVPEALSASKVRGLGAETAGAGLGVRYLLKGSLRREGATLHVNAQLVSTETARIIWSDSFAVAASDADFGESAAVRRVQTYVGAKIVATEDARARRERPNDPNAFDLVLRARALQLLPPSPNRTASVHALYESALRMDPTLDTAKEHLIGVLLNEADTNQVSSKTVLEQTKALLNGKTDNLRTSWGRMFTRLRWLAWQYNRCPETIEAAQKFVAIYPNSVQAMRWLGDCLNRTGYAEEALPILRAVVDRSEGDPYQSHNFRNLQFALLLLGRYDESIAWGQRALSENPEDVGWERARLNRRLAEAYALSGRLDEARRYVNESTRLIPLYTVRQSFEESGVGPRYATQISRLADAQRSAGFRDHADEDADFGVPSDSSVHLKLAGKTPLAAPGATTIRSEELARLIDEKKPLVIDTASFFDGRSLPGAIVLRFSGDGGDVSDAAQDLLRKKMLDVAKGDLTKPVVAVGWNSENFDGRNLALRLVAVGFTHVYWYRGGREAWEVHGLLETDAVPQDW